MVVDAPGKAFPSFWLLVLDLEVAVRLRAEVALVEVVHAHEAVLAARGVARALGVHRDADGARREHARTRGKRRRTYVLTGPKWPLTRPTSSSKIMCQNRVSNLPCRSEVVVTLIASCPPPSRTCDAAVSGSTPGQV